MFMHDRFVFLHVPKTGGMFIRDALGRELPSGSYRDDQESLHAERHEIPEPYQTASILMFVRNPWDWYVSLYHFLMDPGSPRLPKDSLNARFADYILDGYTNTFPEMVRVARRPGTFGLTGAELDAAMQSSSPRVRLLDEGHDMYTAIILGMIGTSTKAPDIDADRKLTVGRYEHLVDDLESFLLREKVPVAEGGIARIRDSKPVNTSMHRHYRQYYDDELCREVSDSCEWIIDEFGYAF